MKDKCFIEHINGITIVHIYDSKITKWDVEQKVNFIKATIPAKKIYRTNMKLLGFEKIDTRFECYINTNNEVQEINYKYRINLCNTNMYNNQILQIALKSFQNDARFCFLEEYIPSSYHSLLENVINNCQYKLLCIYKNKIVGFLLLQLNSSSVIEIKLAAVLSEYRDRGIGIELYRRAIEICKEKKIKFIRGDISEYNLKSINLYSFLKAKFVSLNDVYLKEVN